MFLLSFFGCYFALIHNMQLTFLVTLGDHYFSLNNTDQHICHEVLKFLSLDKTEDNWKPHIT